MPPKSNTKKANLKKAPVKKATKPQPRKSGCGCGYRGTTTPSLTWNQHLTRYRNANNCTLKQAMVLASPSWREAKYGSSSEKVDPTKCEKITFSTDPGEYIELFYVSIGIEIYQIIYDVNGQKYIAMMKNSRAICSEISLETLKKYVMEDIENFKKVNGENLYVQSEKSKEVLHSFGIDPDIIPNAFTKKARLKV